MEFMKKKVPFKPTGYYTVTPYLNIRGAAKAIEFYKKAFGAKEKGRLDMGNGQLGHAEIQIGDSRIMLADEAPDWGNKSPDTLGGSSVGICIYVKNVDDFVKKAVAAGAKLERPVEDQFYGDRSGTLVDPFGHRWTIATHIENVSFKQMEKRAKALYGQQK
jgi:PhnB protein